MNEQRRKQEKRTETAAEQHLIPLQSSPNKGLERNNINKNKKLEVHIIEIFVIYRLSTQIGKRNEMK